MAHHTRRKNRWTSTVARGHFLSVVDELTRISGELANAGERSAVDQKASALLSLAK